MQYMTVVATYSSIKIHSFEQFHPYLLIIINHGFESTALIDVPLPNAPSVYSAALAALRSTRQKLLPQKSTKEY